MAHGGGRSIRSFGISLGVTCLASALLVVLKETSPPVLLAMKRLGGHHWVAHGIFDLVLFVALGIGLQRLNGGEGVVCSDRTLLVSVVGGVLLSITIVAVFYGVR